MRFPVEVALIFCRNLQDEITCDLNEPRIYHGLTQ
jgi:hypothetical protein